MTHTSPADSTQRRAFSTRQWVILTVCFAIAMVDGFDMLMLSFIAPLVGKQFSLAPMQIGKLFAIGYVGAVAGALALGPVADRLGRRIVLLVSLTIVTIFTFLCSRAESYDALLWLRLAAGIGLGGAMPAVIAMTAENMPMQYRASAVTWMFLGFPMGAVVGGAVTAANLSHGWQAIFVSGSIAALCTIVLARLVLPETRPQTVGLRANAAPSQGIFTSLIAQFAEQRAIPALLLWLSVFCVMVVSYFLLSWMPLVLNRAGISPAKAALAGVLFNLGGITGALILSFAIKRVGPWRPVAVVFAAGSCLIWLLGQQIESQALIFTLLFAIGLCVFGGQISVPALAVHLFPPEVRGAGIGWTMGIGRLGSIAGPLIGGALMATNTSWSNLFLLVAAPTLVAAMTLMFVEQACARKARASVTSAAGVTRRSHSTNGADSARVQTSQD